MSAEEISVPSGPVRLSATVWAPESPRAIPGVVLVGGSGATDRTNDGYFNQIRDRFLAAGLAVLAFDKRGVGRSTGDWASADVDDLAGDVAAGVAALRDRPGVDCHAVGIFGHSEGGWVALRACAKDIAPRYLVLNSCPAVSFFDAEVHALVTAGVSIDQARAFFERLRAAAETDCAAGAARRVLAPGLDPVLGAVLEHVGFRLTDHSWSQLRAWIGYTPDADLNRLQVRTLAIYGSEDALVPVSASVQRLAALAPTVRSRVFTGADHRLCVDGSLAPGYLDTLTAWCASPL